MDARQAIDALRRLSPQDIRDRLTEIHAEEQSLRVLLRAAVKAERCQPRGPRQEAVQC